MYITELREHEQFWLLKLTHTDDWLQLGSANTNGYIPSIEFDLHKIDNLDQIPNTLLHSYYAF